MYTINKIKYEILISINPISIVLKHIILRIPNRALNKSTQLV